MRIPVQTEPIQRSLASLSAVQNADKESSECQSGVEPSGIFDDFKKFNEWAIDENPMSHFGFGSFGF